MTQFFFQNLYRLSCIEEKEKHFESSYLVNKKNTLIVSIYIDNSLYLTLFTAVTQLKVNYLTEVDRVKHHSKI